MSKSSSRRESVGKEEEIGAPQREPVSVHSHKKTTELDVKHAPTPGACLHHRAAAWADTRCCLCSHTPAFLPPHVHTILRQKRTRDLVPTANLKMHQDPFVSQMALLCHLRTEPN